ncbi:MAG: aspartate aminotransferase [Sporomusa sp.]|nr:aspartate aminotransferase [Sporomusa sp.]
MNIKEAKRMEMLPFSGIRKIQEKGVQLQKQGVKVIFLDNGRPDFDTPRNIKECAKRCLDEGKVFYTSNFGLIELRQAIAEKLAKENNIVYDPATEIMVTVGVTEAVSNLLLSLVEAGDEVLVPAPTFLTYRDMVRMIGAVPLSYNLNEEKDFQVDIQELERKITDRTKMLVLISPNNPTGSVLSKEELEQIAAIAIKHDLLVLADEIYEKIIYDGKKHYSIAAFPGMRERTVTLNGFSKAYSMTGWRVGYIAAPAAVINAAVRMHQNTTICAASFAQYAAIEALKNSEDSVREMVAEFKRRRDYIVNAINSIDRLSCSNPSGAFYIWMNIKQLNKTSNEFAEYILSDAGVTVVPGTTFGELGEGYIRISYANSYENLVEACERIRKSVLKL